MFDISELRRYLDLQYTFLVQMLTTHCCVLMAVTLDLDVVVIFISIFAFHAVD